MKIFGYSVEECLTFFMLVVVGYFIAKLFSQKCNGFSVGAQTTCDGIKSRTRCRKFHPDRCEWKDGKCTNKNTPAPAPAGKKDNGSECNDNNDCKSGYCNMNVHGIPNFNGQCEIKQKPCKNDKQNPPFCDTCINDNLDINSGCTKCINDKHQYPDCTECKEGHKRYPLCTGLKECNELNNVWCGFHPFCKLDKTTGKCVPK